MRKENSNLRFEVMHLKRTEKSEIEELQTRVHDLKEKIKTFEDKESYLSNQLKVEKEKLNNILSNDLVKDLLVSLSAEKSTLTDMRKAIIKTILTNSVARKSIYSELEHDFWCDIYYNCSHRVFNRICDTLNGPWRNTVERWGGPKERNSFNLSWRM